MSAEEGARDVGRISVSRDALRAELATMELRLVEKLATRAEVEIMRADMDGLKRWRAYVTGAVAVSVGLGSTAVGVVLAYLT
jgi:hypothetical protein